LCQRNDVAITRAQIDPHGESLSISPITANYLGTADAQAED
jgi:hypothetical protein